jgi:hypothetical protein
MRLYISKNGLNNLLGFYNKYGSEPKEKSYCIDEDENDSKIIYNPNKFEYDSNLKKITK